MKSFSVVVVLTLIFALSATQAHAGRRQEVLGVATPASEVNFPPVTSGPGYFLPNSPLFPLDQTFQAIRVAINTDPLNRARLHSSIAGERLAELRIMFEKNDEEGIDKALSLLTKEMNQAALKLSEAKANGKDNNEVQKLAGELNEQLKEQRTILKGLEDQTQDSLQLKLATARQQLREAKLSVEDSLPEETLQNEIEAGSKEDLDESTRDATQSVTRLKSDLENLRLQLEMSQIRHLEAREKAIETAIDTKEAQLRAKGVDPDNLKAREAAQTQTEIEEAMETAEETQKQLDEIKRVVEEATKIESQTRPKKQ